MEVRAVSEVESAIQVALPTEDAAQQVIELPKIPEPTATGNDKIAILKHEFSLTDPVSELPTPPGVELAIRNVSERDIATATFEVTFYDQSGQIISTVKRNEVELKPETSRALRIDSSTPHYESERVKSYAVRLVRTTTTDVERVQARRHEIRTIETGEEQISGIVKNISEHKTDAAVVWAFFDPANENIGTRVVILRDIEPYTIRQYEFKFMPQEGESVRSYSITIGTVVD
jgi:hypothetical protein